jgi:hypothetical protein
MNFPRILVLIAYSTAAAERPATREWTSTDGRKIQAALTAVTESEVVLRMADGKDYPVPILRLSAADQEWLKNQLPNKVTEAGAGTQGGKTQARPDTPAAERTWPRLVALPEAPEPKVVLEDEAGRRFVYQTEHYEFECDSKLSTKAVKDLSRVFEATWLLNTSPWASTSSLS